MTEEKFKEYINDNLAIIETIKSKAHQLHDDVNQTYDKIHPYSFHLDSVVDKVLRYGSFVCEDVNDILPLIFGAYFHDTIEDARLTYNNVLEYAKEYMPENDARIATEIVYALTNDKGRTRAERAGDKYYRGIRETPLAPVVKLADRLANLGYSRRNKEKNDANSAMFSVYLNEMPHFLRSISSEEKDIRLSLPPKMLNEIEALMK